MKHRRLGTHGPGVSALGLGCMGMSTAYGVPDDTESVRTLDRAVELGVTLLDTADAYGRGANEESLGCTPAQAVLAWLLAQGEDIVPIPGTKRRGYLDENAAAAGIELGPEQAARLRAAVPDGAVAGERYPLAALERLGH
ncbi:aldo/keto reductase [Streptomyces sp. NPDC048637]|uniref:aldo/keto reductase n=1 Tax=Streptomyces sp. NPDC048637 TaxID=3155636 RepID=UPI0034220CBD